jgi:hypothetical protein
VLNIKKYSGLEIIVISKGLIKGASGGPVLKNGKVIGFFTKDHSDYGEAHSLLQVKHIIDE